MLVVEDDPDVRAYSCDVLRELGYAVIAAADGGAAIDAIDGDARIDLVFTDVVLPGDRNGRDIADHARRRRPGTPILFTTGYARDVIVQHERLDVGVDLIAKPFSYAALALKIRAMLRTSPAA